jgi:hypothetical protein
LSLGVFEQQQIVRRRQPDDDARGQRRERPGLRAMAVHVGGLPFRENVPARALDPLPHDPFGKDVAREAGPPGV